MRTPLSFLRILSVILLTGSITTTSVAAADPTPAPNNGGKFVLMPKKPVTSRPKAPSMQQVSCTYSEGNLYFEFAIPEGGCQLILSDLATGETVGASFDSAVTEPVYVGYHSTATLTVTTANGNTYTGTW